MCLLHGFLASSFTWILKSGSLPVTCLKTLRPFRSGFEPLTQGFSVLCSNQLSYLNHFPKVCFLHRIAPYLTTWLVREKPFTKLRKSIGLVRQAFEQLFQLPPNLPTCFSLKTWLWGCFFPKGWHNMVRVFYRWVGREYLGARDNSL